MSITSVADRARASYKKREPRILYSRQPFAQSFGAEERNIINVIGDENAARIRALLRSAVNLRGELNPDFQSRLRVTLASHSWKLWLFGFESARAPKFAEPLSDEMAAAIASLPDDILRYINSQGGPGRFTLLQLRALIATYQHFDPIAESITQTVEGAIATALANAIARGASVEESAKAVGAAVYGISDRRARQIAHTETIKAFNLGRIEGLKSNPLVRFKVWLAAPNACPQCLSLADQGPIPIDDSFTDDEGDEFDAAPAHPYCRCGVVGSVTAT